jgi:copper homeostasis protein (lipoprotein)
MTRTTTKLLTAACIIALSSAVSSCKQNKQNSTTNQKDTTAVNGKPDSLLQLNDYAGTYEGTLPSADGPGTKVVLTLNTDSTYSWTSDDQGKEKLHDEASGIFRVLNGNVLMLVRPSSSEHTFYKVKDSRSIIMTDSLGNEPEGETAQFYVLKKK